MLTIQVILSNNVVNAWNLVDQTLNYSPNSWMKQSMGPVIAKSHLSLQVFI